MGEQSNSGCEGLLGGVLSVILPGPVNFAVRPAETYPPAIPMALVVCDPGRVEELNALATANPDFRINDFPGCRLMTMTEFAALQQSLEV